MTRRGKTGSAVDVRVRLFPLVALLAWSPLVAAEAPVLEVRWAEEAERGPLRAGDLLAGVPGGALRIEEGPDGPHNVVVWTLDAPPLTGKRWRIEGRVRHLNVEGEGHLSLLSTLDGRDYFVKTVAPTGPLGRMTGHSDWREFVLPFDALDRKVPPEKLKLQVFLPGKGTVDLGSFKLYADFDDALVADLGPRLGWNSATFGLGAGLLGSFFGFLGAFIGFLGASKKSPKTIRLVQRVAVGLGAAALVTGSVASYTGAAGGWLITVGLIGIVLFSALDRVIRKSSGLAG